MKHVRRGVCYRGVPCVGRAPMAPHRNPSVGDDRVLVCRSPVYAAGPSHERDHDDDDDGDDGALEREATSDGRNT